MSDARQIKVWDPFVRVFHWALAAGFFVAYFTEEEALGIHTVAGYTVLGLVLVRVLWGLVGTRHARFSDFVHGPRTVLAYLKQVIALRAPRYVGHNPAGGAMVVALMVALLLTTLLGLATYGAQEHAGPLAGLMAGVGKSGAHTLKEVHEVIANLTLALVGFHVAGVVAESLLHQENLVRAMLTGFKRAEQ